MFFDNTMKNSNVKNNDNFFFTDELFPLKEIVVSSSFKGTIAFKRSC